MDSTERPDQLLWLAGSYFWSVSPSTHGDRANARRTLADSPALARNWPGKMTSAGRSNGFGIPDDETKRVTARHSAAIKEPKNGRTTDFTDDTDNEGFGKQETEQELTEDDQEH